MSSNFSLWLVPEEDSEEYNILQDLIKNYTEKYDSPAFKPHVTVLGGIESEKSQAKRKANKLAESESSFNIRLIRPHFSTTRTQCFFLIIEPSERLMEIHNQACKIYSKDNSFYVPHLSLLYGDTSFEEREQLYKQFDMEVLPMNFKANKLLLIDTNGTPSDYESIADFVKNWEKTASYRLRNV